MEKKIAFDIDGVLTDSRYIPPTERSCETYRNLKPNKVVCDLVMKLADKGFRIYIISSRKCKQTAECFAAWRVKVGLEPQPFWELHFEIPKNKKARLAESLGCAILVDDSMEAIATCDDTSVKGILLNTGRYTTREYTKFLKEHPAHWVMIDSYLEERIVDYLREAGISF